MTLVLLIFSVLVTSSYGEGSPDSYQYINVRGKIIVETGNPSFRNNSPPPPQQPQPTPQPTQQPQPQQPQPQPTQQQPPQPPRPSESRFSPISRVNQNQNINIFGFIPNNRVFTRPISQPVPQPIQSPVFERAQERVEFVASPKARGQISVADYPATNPASSSYGR